MTRRNENEKITYTGTIKELAAYFGATGKNSNEIKNDCRLMYEESYKFPVKKHVWKSVSFAFVLAFVLAGGLMMVLADITPLCIALMSGVFLALMIFFPIRKIEFPNEVYSGWGLFLLFCISSAWFVLFAIQAEELIPITVISILFVIIGLVAGKKRLLGLLTPLIAVSGYSLFVYLEAELIAYFLTIGYDFLLLFITYGVSGKEPAERIAFKK